MISSNMAVNWCITPSQTSLEGTVAFTTVRMPSNLDDDHDHEACTKSVEQSVAFVYSRPGIKVKGRKSRI